ncbi:MAG TPA: DUF4105 domain-containing protein [Kofleriaceae bacterium]|nr:DUF4105 domain-containing protein [Kofleriaceae bacterium]
MRRAAALVALLLVVGPARARAADPTSAPDDRLGEPAGPGDAPIVELYTMGQGDLMFEKFGHAALCIRYPRAPRRTRCYNYGSTDFDSVVPLFWGFLRGRSVFWVSVSSRARMLEHYREADRTIWRQVLALPPAQAAALADALARDSREENRYYDYHHYRDNCSTRLRDHLDRATGGALSAAARETSRHGSYREISRSGFAADTGLLLASDLILGREADRRPDNYEAMFLPDVLRAEVEARLGAAPELVYTRRGPPFPADPGLGGRWLWLLLAALFAAPLALSRALWGGRRERAAIAAGVIPLALLGLVLWTLAIASPLPEVRWNEALLVFMPLDLVLVFGGPELRRRYARARAGELVLVSLLRALGILRQPLWLLVAVPLGVMLLVATARRAPAPVTSAVGSDGATPAVAGS